MVVSRGMLSASGFTKICQQANYLGKQIQAHIGTRSLTFLTKNKVGKLKEIYEDKGHCLQIPSKQRTALKLSLTSYKTL
jgi:hypothetical protein